MATPHTETQATFWDHLEVLRWALLRSLGVLIVAAIGLFMAMPTLFEEVILAPSRGDFALYRLLEWLGATTGEFHITLQNIHVAAQFTTHISASLWGALLITLPYLGIEIWRFVRPGLYPHERRGVGVALAIGALLFLAGCVVGYFLVFPLTFRFLATYQLSGEIMNQITLHSYMNNFMGVVLVMGVAFELPIVTWLLSRIGILNRTTLQTGRRYAVVALLLLSALITPSGDPFTLGVVFLPLYLLYEVGILCARRA